MPTAAQILQIIVALGILNVWFLRFGKPSPWRGGSAKNMVEEFAVYGLSSSVMYGVGFVKVLLAVLLLVGVWVPALTVPAALVLAAILLGSVAMHVKVKDPLTKSIPAAAILLLSLLVAVMS
jgi:uncharacterized membrane protein YkgB